MGELERVDAAEVERRLATLGGHQAVDRVQDARWRMREMTALVGYFSVGDLDDGDPPSDALQQFVLEDAEPVLTPSGTRWRLRPMVREETLRRLAQAGRLHAARSPLPPSGTDVSRTMAEAYVAGTAPALERQTSEELHGTLQAIEWLAPTAVAVPTEDEVRACLEMANLLQPLRLLVGDAFVGRVRELQRLHDYVEPTSPRRRRKGAHRVRRPLMIHGPGGIGKSTLVAKFVLDYATLGADDRVPFAYLSFDRSDLRADAPLTLLAEAAHQLAAQYPALAGRARRLAESALNVHRAYVAARIERTPAAKSAAARRQRSGSDLRDIVGRFGSLVAATGSGDRPVLLVLDTFEVAQRSGREAVDQTWRMLDDLANAAPRLRVVVAGRAMVEGHDVDEVALGPLAADEALALVRARLRGMEVSDSFLRSAVRKVGANPLSLRLVADLLHREGATALRRMATRRRILFRISAEEVQGVLYRRILDHLPDEDLQRIASPGLVVRRITPDVIRHVLAEPCGLGEIDDGRARDLFQRLTREASLVHQIAPDTVVHRSDVRRVMLPLLARADAGTVEEIHRRAVAWFAAAPGLEAKTEELYHRLAVGESASVLDEDWDDDAAIALEDALDELPPASQAFLADRLGWAVDPGIFAKAEDETWARQATRVGRTLLDAGRPREALELLEQRSSKTTRPLTTPLIVEALAASKQAHAALDLVRSSLRWATEEGMWSTYLDLELLGARVAEDAADYDQALRWLYDARSVAADVNDATAHLAAGVAAVRVHRRSGKRVPGDLRDEVLEEAMALTAGERERTPTLLRDLAAEFGDEHPEFVSQAAKVAGLDTESTAGDVLASTLSADQQQELADFARGESEAEDDPPAAGSDLSWLARQTVIEQGQVIGGYLESDDADESWKQAVVEAYRAESDTSAF